MELLGTHDIDLLMTKNNDCFSVNDEDLESGSAILTQADRGFAAQVAGQ
jgi:hypothetical protein